MNPNDSGADSREFVELSKTLTSDIVPRPVPWDTIDVTIGMGTAFLRYCAAYWRRIQSVASLTGGVLINVTEEQFTAYCMTLVQSRVQQARYEDRGGDTRPVIKPNDPVRVPSSLSAMLAGIGVVELPDQGLRLVPMSVTPRELLLTRLEALEVSDAIAPLQDVHGFKFGLGYARDRRGAADLMIMHYIDGEVRTHSKSPAALYALFAYVMELSWMSPLGTRVFYASADLLDLKIGELARH